MIKGVKGSFEASVPVAASSEHSLKAKGSHQLEDQVVGRAENSKKITWDYAWDRWPHEMSEALEAGTVTCSNLSGRQSAYKLDMKNRVWRRKKIFGLAAL